MLILIIPASLIVPYERVKPILRKRVEHICQQLIDTKKYNENSLLCRMIHAQVDEHIITSEQLTQIALSLILVGQATTTIAFSWLLHSLASHPDLQTRLFEEYLKHID